MEKGRLQTILDNILGWTVEHDDEFVKCLIEASGMTNEEALELDLGDYIETDDTDEDDEQYKDAETLFEMDKCGVSASFYWDSHGKKIPWTWNGRKSFNRYFQHVKLISVKEEFKWSFQAEPDIIECWYLLADGEKIDLGEITSYKVNSNSLRLKCCVGAG